MLNCTMSAETISSLGLPLSTSQTLYAVILVVSFLILL